MPTTSQSVVTDFDSNYIKMFNLHLIDIEVRVLRISATVLVELFFTWQSEQWLKCRMVGNGTFRFAPPPLSVIACPSLALKQSEVREHFDP